jgi:hypothetical protein
LKSTSLSVIVRALAILARQLKPAPDTRAAAAETLTAARGP